MSRSGASRVDNANCVVPDFGRIQRNRNNYGGFDGDANFYPAFSHFHPYSNPNPNQYSSAANSHPPSPYSNQDAYTVTHLHPHSYSYSRSNFDPGSHIGTQLHGRHFNSISDNNHRGNNRLGGNTHPQLRNDRSSQFLLQRYYCCHRHQPGYYQPVRY